MTMAEIEVPQAQIAELCQRNGIRKLSLFGSVLTGRFTDSSDIDILVDFQPGEGVLADVRSTCERPWTSAGTSATKS